MDWARILEKQNWLQMSQVFLCIRTLIIGWFCFFKASLYLIERAIWRLISLISAVSNRTRSA
jgi:hypothetical protein